MNDLILKCTHTVGQELLLTAAIRDLHRSLPGMFRTDVRSSFPDLWLNNPFLVPLQENDSVVCIECQNVLSQNCNELPVHSVLAYANNLSERLRINIRPTAFKPDLYLSADEKANPSPVITLAQWTRPYWVLNAGSTHRETIKQWDISRYQQIVDHFQGRIQFVQVGLAEDLHPTIDRVIDLRGKTTLRELIRVMYHAAGVLTSPGLISHLAAAIETKDQSPRSCIVIGGGREPAHWNAYPGQRYLSTVGLFPCCQNGGCWRSRTVPLGDGQTEDARDRLCVNVSNGTPVCLEAITVAEVVSHIEQLFQKSLETQDREWVRISTPSGMKIYPELEHEVTLTASTALAKSEEFIKKLRDYPGGYSGKGIVICAGGPELFANAWVCVNMLRHLGCQLPIQIWHLGPQEVDERMKTLVNGLGVDCVDALEMRRHHPTRRLGGWELKPYSIIHSPFKEVLFLDADNVPVLNPEFLFESPQFQETGAIFWPDFGHLKPDASIWKLCGIAYRDEPEWETGQIVIDKERRWRTLSLAMWYNEHSDFFYHHILGDKETFHMAFRKLESPVAMPERPVSALRGVLCQHDFNGRRIFQHRSSRKWKLYEENVSIPGFLYEKECLTFLRKFRESWATPDNLIWRIDMDTKSAMEQNYIHEICRSTFEYCRIGFDQRRMTFSVNGSIKTGAGGCEKYWDIYEESGQVIFEISDENAVTCRLTEHANGVWRGRWSHFEQMPIELRKVTPALESPPFLRLPQKQIIAEEKRRVIFRAPINGYTGYGLHAVQVVQDLTRMGYDVRIRATYLNEEHAPIPLAVRKHIACQETQDEWELLLIPPGGFGPRQGIKSVLFTMWESTRIPQNVVERLNQAYQIAVPCQWNASCFSAAGVDRPIHVIPLGIKTDIFRFTAMEMDGPCIFGAAGRTESGGMRKGIEEVILAFQEAFPNTKEVRLRIKIFPDDELPVINDERIEVIGRYLSEEELADWFSQLTCFVSCSHGEAWGLMLHQALAVGRPVMSPLFGGVTEFFTGEMGYPVDFRLTPAGGYYEGCGHWAEVDRRDVVRQMQSVFHNRAEAREKGLKGSHSVANLSWENSNLRLLNVMKNIGMVT